MLPPAVQTVSLVREVRFAADAGLLSLSPAVTNNHAGWPAQSWIAPHLTLRVLLTGVPDPATGMLENIITVDEMVRRHVILAVIAQLAPTGGTGFPACAFVKRCTIEQAVQAAGQACQAINEGRNGKTAARLIAVRLAASPYLSAAIQLEGSVMENPVYLTQQFEFSASHRLHSPALSAAENIKIFGKCNNPAGHGHNYVLDVTLQGQPDKTGSVLNLIEFERIVKERVLDAMDHRNLSVEVPPFNAGVNSTVEQIAQACFDRLTGQFAPAALHRVRVWETPKTYAEVYAGGPTPADSLG